MTQKVCVRLFVSQLSIGCMFLTSVCLYCHWRNGSFLTHSVCSQVWKAFRIDVYAPSVMRVTLQYCLYTYNNKSSSTTILPPQSFLDFTHLVMNSVCLHNTVSLSHDMPASKENISTMRCCVSRQTACKWWDPIPPLDKLRRGGPCTKIIMHLRVPISLELPRTSPNTSTKINIEVPHRDPNVVKLAAEMYVI